MQLRFGKLIVLACMGLAVACTSGTEGGTAGNTELNLDIVNPGGDTGAGFSIDRVDYRITCAGNAPGTYDIPPADTNGTDYNYNDSVDISGAFEVVDTRDPPVWQAVMDLPPGDCRITLSVYEDDEIVCVGSQTLVITEDATTKYDIVLVCSLSVDTPDGMADVDGTFEFITGNLCPKLYVLNAIPSGQAPPGEAIPVQPDGPFVGQAVTEVQYRAKDPDTTCGNNCDPQSCTTDNPPVCTPYPSNINDPACNPAFGGDPNSAACQAGTFAGLVCTVAAWPSASNPGGPNTGPPGGTFYSPRDGSPVGPVLPVNLNLASGIPGIVLPGLGGPAGTNAENSPAYPGLPNTNGSLPPLYYACDINQPGPTFVTVSCSDGDAECDQSKFITLICPGENFCISQPPDCSGSNECLTDGVCNPTCDPADLASCTPPDTRCPGQDNNQPAGTDCSFNSGNVCDGNGACVQCLLAENEGRCLVAGGLLGNVCTSNADCPVTGTGGGICLPTNGDCDISPIDCQVPSRCTGSNTCTGRTQAPVGAPCSNGECDSNGDCIFQLVPQDCSEVITVGCGNNITSDVSILPYQLDVNIPGGVVAGGAVATTITGIAEFSETFLDAAQGAVPGGVTQAGLVDLVATVQARGPGMTGADVPVGPTAIPYTCVYGGSCDPANNLASVPGLQPNSDCVPTGKFNPCTRIVVIPTSSDCAAGGTCDTLGKLSQCAANGFCVTAGLPLPLANVAASYTAGSGACAVGGAACTNNAACGANGPCETANGLLGWADNPPNPLAVGVPPIDGDGTYNMLQPTYTGVAGAVGLAVNAGGLAVTLECVQAVDSGGPDGVGVPDDASPTPDSAMCNFTVQVPPN